MKFGISAIEWVWYAAMGVSAGGRANFKSQLPACCWRFFARPGPANRVVSCHTVGPSRMGYYVIDRCQLSN